VIQLRGYQNEIVTRAGEALRVHDSVLIQMPTGTGKTVVASAITQRANSKSNKVWFACHRDFLMAQTAGTFKSFSIDYGFIAATKVANAQAENQIAAIASLKRRIEKLPVPDLVFIDEAHHCSAAGWTFCIEHWLGHGAKIVGLSATPRRLDGKGLGEHFGSMVTSPPVSWFIEHGYLADYRLFAPTAIDMTGVHSRAGDFVKSELEEKFDKPSITGDIIANWREHADSMTSIGFAVSVEHSKHLTAAFNAAGIKAEHLEGKTPSKERSEAAMRLATGETKILWNVDLFGEGYDLSAQAGTEVTVEAVVLARPTKSEALYLQQVGRALRPKADGSKAIILDHASNCVQQGHGLPDDEREWSLEGRAGNKKNSEQTIPIRQCPKCFRVHKPAPVCVGCGFVYPQRSREIEEREGTLEEVKRAELQVKKDKRREVGMARNLEELKALGKQRGYHPAWAYKIFKSRGSGSI
jgi:DNA repair protein RadD